MDVRRIAGQQDTSLSVRGRLPCDVGEPRDPGRAVHAVVGSVNGLECCLEVAQARLRACCDALFGHHDADGPLVTEDNLAVADLVLHPAEGMNAVLVSADAQLWCLGDLDLCDQATNGRVPSGEVDAGRFPDEASTAVAADEIVPTQIATVRQMDQDTGLVWRKPRHLTAVLD